MQKAYGWSLPELLIVLSLVILTSLAATPSLNQSIKRNESEKAARTFLEAIRLAHSQASFRNTTITLCPVIENACSKSMSQDIVVFIDDNKNRKVDEDEELIRYFRISSEGNYVNLNVSFGRKYMRFKGDGTIMEAGSLSFCAERNDLYGKSVTVNYAGRAYLNESISEKDLNANCS